MLRLEACPSTESLILGGVFQSPNIVQWAAKKSGFFLFRFIITVAWHGHRPLKTNGRSKVGTNPTTGHTNNDPNCWALPPCIGPMTNTWVFGPNKNPTEMPQLLGQLRANCWVYHPPITNSLLWPNRWVCQPWQKQTIGLQSFKVPFFFFFLLLSHPFLIHHFPIKIYKIENVQKR